MAASQHKMLSVQLTPVPRQEADGFVRGSPSDRHGAFTWGSLPNGIQTRSLASREEFALPPCFSLQKSSGCQVAIKNYLL